MKQFKLGFCLILVCLICIGCTNKIENNLTDSKNDKAYQEFKDRENAALQKEIAYKYKDTDIKATIQYNIAIAEDTESRTVDVPYAIVLECFSDNAEQRGTYNAYCNSKMGIFISNNIPEIEIQQEIIKYT